MSSDREYQRLIHANRWLKLRRAKLTAQPLCEDCLSRGETTAATEVHHITPVEEGSSLRERRALMYSPSNLRSLCHECHAQRHLAMGKGTMKARRERRASQKAEILERFFG
ncbi:MAG: HNH endonuclease, partial [Bacteroidales bacterium]|nr:HNH endonuclease [Bacteroidales bacterium]